MISLELSVVLTVVLVLLGVGLGGVIAWLAMQLARVQRRLHSLEQAQQRVNEYIRGVSAGAVGQGQHVARLEQDLTRLRERMERVASTDAGGSGSAFNHAIRLAQRGATADELMDACGLSQMEADLVVLLHRKG